MNIKLTIIAAAIAATIAPAFAAVDDSEKKPVEVISIKSDFNQQNILQAPASIAIVDEQLIKQRGAEHLQDVLNATANVNFSSGASRARFFQIRGIGERSEFVDAVNPSVGVAIDGIDYSGIGTIANLFDIGQVEVFRGPQGTRFGANAMAGMISLHGNLADGEQGGQAQLSIGNYNSQSLAVAHGASLDTNVAYRMSLQHNSSDGFIDNTYLNKSDTNGIEETAARLNLAIGASDDLKLDITAHYFDTDNGYDAFSLDNDRNTRSDQPGFDEQLTKALGVNAHYQGFVSADVSLHTSYADSDLAYGYDEDWTYEGFHEWGYSSFDHYFRDHQNRTIDLRSASKNDSNGYWVAGLYRQDKKVELNRQAVYGFTSDFDSRMDTTNMAMYGQKDWIIDDSITITTGLRLEQHDADYQDSVDTIEEVNDTLWGGQISAKLQVTDRSLIYTKYSRGYKAGGVNGEAIGKAKVDGQDVTAAFLAKRTTFDPETLHTVEFGVKGSNLSGNLFIGMSIFYAEREDMQLKGYATEASDGEDATIFVGYIENAASGSNWGIEADVTVEITPKLQAFANLGYLETKVKDFIAQDGTNMHGREQAHAPEYQFNVGAIYTINPQWYIRANIEGKDEFYYSMSHNAQSDDSVIANFAIGYEHQNWDVTVWGRNVFDEDYHVRGFSFGNDPRDGYETNTYTQLGEPARVGATINYSF